MPPCELIAVTFGEFQTWISDGELRLHHDRIQWFEAGADGDPLLRGPQARLLLERSPHVGLEDEQVLVVV